MTQYRIERLDIDSKWREQIGSVVSDAFGGDPGTALERVALTTLTRGERASAFFGAIEGNELIGFNAFISHDLWMSGEKLAAFQSCWTATSSAHRGKRVFQNIILEAHCALAFEGADFVIGWPNPNSEPLFVHKLGYRREGSVKRNVPGLLVPKVFGHPASRPMGIAQNDDQLINLKRRIHGDRLFVEGEGPDVLWGVLRSRQIKFGSVPYFEVGGVRWSEPGAGRLLARNIQRQLPSVAYWQIVSERRNTINTSIGKFVESPTNPLIWFPLKDGLPEGPFDFFAGIRDVF